jgi:hypothetical protein
MTSKLAHKVGLKLFEKHLQNYEPRDPVYETYVDKKGREKKRRVSCVLRSFVPQKLTVSRSALRNPQRALPPGLSPRDARTLQTLQKRAHHLDAGFSICGFRFGYTVLIGFIPLVGDIADVLLSYLLVVRRAKNDLELPTWLVSRMMFNMIVSGAVGVVPVVGDVAVAVWKANSRNVALLEEFLRVRGEEFLRAQEEEARKAAGGGAVTTGANTGVKPSGGGWFKRMTSGGKNANASTSAEQGQGVQGMPGGTVAPREDPNVVKPGAGRRKGENVTI